MCKTVNSRGPGVGEGIGVDVAVGVGIIGVGVLVGVEVGVGMGVGVGVDIISLQPNKASPVNTKKPIRNQSLFLNNVIPPDLKCGLSRW